MSDRDGTRRALAVLAGVEREARTARASADATDTVDATDATDDRRGGTSESSVEDGRSDAPDGLTALVDAGSRAVGQGDTATLVAAAERACGDVRRAAAFASAGGFAHLAGAVATTDDPVLAARGAFVLVRLAAWRGDGRAVDRVADVPTGSVAEAERNDSRDVDPVTTDAPRCDDGTGMSVDPVGTDE